MMSLKCLCLGALLLVLSTVCTAEVVPFDHCGSNPEMEARCTVQEVRVTPCPEVEQNKPCVIKRGTQANIQFDYTTESPATSVTSQAYWKTSSDEKPLIGMNTDACLNTPCPVVENERHSYNNSIPISRKFPPRGYHVKWSMLGADESNFECCFVFRIKLVP